MSSYGIQIDGLVAGSQLANSIDDLERVFSWSCPAWHRSISLQT